MSAYEYEPAPAPRERIEDDDQAFERWRAENPAEWERMIRPAKPEGSTK
jgi:hypothetical protein